jgi:hypothetical protein
MAAHGGDLNKAFDAFLASQEDNGRSEIRKALDSFKTGGATLGEVLSMIGAAASRPRGLVYQTAESFPSIVPVLTSGAIGDRHRRPVLGRWRSDRRNLPHGRERDFERAREARHRCHEPGALAQGVQRSDADGVAPREGGAKGRDDLDGERAPRARWAASSWSRPRKLAPALFGKAAATAADVGVQAGGVGAGDVAGSESGRREGGRRPGIESAIATLGYAFGQEAIGVARRGLFHADPRKLRQARRRPTKRSARRSDAQALAEIGTAVSEAKTTQQVPESDEVAGRAGDGQRSERAGLFPDEGLGRAFPGRRRFAGESRGRHHGRRRQGVLRSESDGFADRDPARDYVARVAPPSTGASSSSSRAPSPTECRWRSERLSVVAAEDDGGDRE